MATLIYPHLFCFSYHRHPVNQPQGHPTWQQWQADHAACQVAGRQEYQTQDWEAIYEEKNLANTKKKNSGDTTGLLLYGSVPESQKLLPLEVEVLRTLKKNFASLESSIGQTWLILTQWQPETPQESENEVLQSILKLWSPTSKIKTGVLLGTSFHSTSLKEGENLFVFLAQNEEKMSLILDFRYELQRLFYHEHKIHWSYYQGQKIKQDLINDGFFPSPEEIIPKTLINFKESQSIRGDFHELRKILYGNMEKLERHTFSVEGLSIQLRTLKTNLKAYHKRLNRIQNLCKDYPFLSKLELWSDFAAEQATFYQDQIEQDIESLIPGLRVRDQQIRTLQVIVQAAQGEHDRHLENLIGAAGVGVGFSSAAAGAWAGKTEPFQTLGISVMWGLVSGLVVYGVLHWSRRNR
ncbi:hypothetical protein VB712_09910 [Spirulina sp. CCNP1310]|uniref:hypothetical protein n=1 Tax=Spirulina sp. CCNP1310 TaxID=3110249 RepID=UPI002B2155AC|nr:hypothetical protein [Spirulina sp. CCNP1310]MEA5419539.1 hypothetical protein [Spirulina sp. CCNP1310]